MKFLTVGLILCLACPGFAATKTYERVPIYVDSQDGFSTFIIAALQKKEAPTYVVTDRSKAQYILQSSDVINHTESGASKYARCAFALCSGIQDTATVAVELINVKTTGIDWSYTVHKQRGGGYNQQSMAEAIAKHLRNHLEGKGN